MDDNRASSLSIFRSKTPEVKKYYLVFQKKWKQLDEYPRIKQRIVEGEA